MCSGCKEVDFPIAPAVTTGLRRRQSQGTTDGIPKRSFPICTVVVLQRLCERVSVEE